MLIDIITIAAGVAVVIYGIPLCVIIGGGVICGTAAIIRAVFNKK